MQKVYDEQTFYQAFSSDLEQARALVVIQSPFVSDGRLDKIESWLIGCIKRRIRVCVFVQNPREPERARTVDRIAKRLTDIGVHVTLRKSIHEKLAVIDEAILWDGSLNILSQSDSSERMTRLTDSESVLAAIARHKLSSCDTCRIAQRKGIQSRLVSIGTSVARRRNILRLTQDELAQNLGLSQGVISKVESGEFSTRVTTLIKICDHLGLELRPVLWLHIPSLNEADAD